jgi:two-component system, OmpR family, phosphate regulon sensor histidine kinase PhoR
MRDWFGGRSNGDSLLAPVLLLMVIVALPTTAVLWLMVEATQNERLAVRQRLADAYRGQLALVCDRAIADWQSRLAQLDASVAGISPAESFAACVLNALPDGALADSVIVLDAAGEPAYPALTAHSEVEPTEPDAAWMAAERLELVELDYAAAAAAYDRIATSTSDDNLTARAIQSEARSLLLAGQRVSAAELLEGQVNNLRLTSSVAPDGRFLYADLMLLLVQITKDSNPLLAEKTAGTLASRLNDYAQSQPRSAQRRFVMRELERLFPKSVIFPTGPAEDLAGAYLDRLPSGKLPASLQTTGIPDVWKVASPKTRVLALFHSKTIAAFLRRELDGQVALSDVRLAPVGPGDAGGERDEFLSLAIGSAMPQWRIALSLAGDDPFDNASRKRGKLYIWAAFVTIVATGLLALLMAAALRRQMRISRLKNDLVATVSHELKTPLSAMRLLVDTLLNQEDQDAPSPQQAREYLQLIAQENLRLSRLIDNFLTFSRMEHGKQLWTFAKLRPEGILHRAIDAMQERLSEPLCQFEVRVEPALPDVRGDADALVTVLVNLLDNSCKYSSPPKQIVLRAFSRRQQVCFAVEDDGVGLSARQKDRIFEQFYQVDQQLSRTAGGCGLGLSIVHSIVTGHGGTIEVQSEPGKGSSFVVTLPAIASHSPSMA